LKFRNSFAKEHAHDGVKRIRARAAIFACVACLLAAAGCRLDMHVQPRYNPYDPTDFFGDGRSARQPVAGTVPRDANVGETDEASAGGSAGGNIGGTPSSVTRAGGSDGDANANAFPFAMTREVLERGRERFNIFCAPCHGLGGDGDGMIVQRGFQTPPSYHLDRLRNAPAGHFFDVITNGFGAMYPYGYRVPVRDRWAIVAYIRALQLSRQATIDEVPPAERQKLLGEPQ
jgi:Cytochrome C oxidase, cbb3-type, subunit III